MIRYLKNINLFGKNIILVFLGSSFVSTCNLLFQLMVAHRLSPTEFGTFNSLLAIFVLVSAPLTTIQTGFAKYVSEFNAQNQEEKIKALFSHFLDKVLWLVIITFIIFLFFSSFLTGKLKISNYSLGFMITLLVSVSWLMPVFTGMLQGLELFKWYTFTGSFAGITKLILAVVLIGLGLNIFGALSAILASSLVLILISSIPLRKYLKRTKDIVKINIKEFILFLLPVATSTFCFMALVSSDMILVKYFFTPEDSGVYSIAQMVGKIFLFLPTAISVVMFPRVSNLQAQNLETRKTLKKSLFLASCLCFSAALFFNFFPEAILKVLTGKVIAESISLGRLFSISMSFYALLFLLINYFLSLKQFYFIKYLVLFTILQIAGVIFFHHSLFQVQLVLCLNAFLLFLIFLKLLKQKKAFIWF